MHKLYLVRHGSTTVNEQGRLRGWMNPELSPLGRQQAREVAAKLPRGLPLYCSDLLRARQTAEEIGVPIVTEALRPWNVGILAGLPTEATHPKLVQYQQNGLRVPFGEHWSEFVARFAKFLRTLCDDSILVTHYRNVAFLVGNVPPGNVVEYADNV